ncbi:MAG: SPASM domain-containing protein, partial [Promethearchaeota archaeon]
ECDKNNIDINFSKLIMTFKRSQILSDAETLLKEAKELAKRKGIFLETPPIFPELKERRCPYIERDAAVINVHGDVIPCYNYIHDSVSYIDGNMRSESKISFGNINTSDLKTIWNSQKYMDFRAMLKGDNFNKNVPYCGDCPYVMANCFYTKNNESDCYGNKPGCNQCLYSYNLIKCIFDK